MEKKMLVVQALDERDLLIKKIMDKTEAAQFLDYVKPQAERTWRSCLSREEFAREAQGELQQILDWIRRFEQLNAAITRSNAETFLETSRGRMTISCAISLRNRLRGSSPYGGLADFEGRLIEKMKLQYEDAMALVEEQNMTADGKHRRKLELCDPLNIRRRIQRLQAEKEILLAELETGIKISNATTWLTLGV